MLISCVKTSFFHKSQVLQVHPRCPTAKHGRSLSQVEGLADICAWNGASLTPRRPIADPSLRQNVQLVNSLLALVGPEGTRNVVKVAASENQQKRRSKHCSKRKQNLKNTTMPDKEDERRTVAILAQEIHDARPIMPCRGLKSVKAGKIIENAFVRLVCQELLVPRGPSTAF